MYSKCVTSKPLPARTIGQEVPSWLVPFRNENRLNNQQDLKRSIIAPQKHRSASAQRGGYGTNNGMEAMTSH